mmetsp:Transcript_1167/g.979  ORF Transcript_1167/g.979 Transcript_1167/m.979 type:complete len:119 (-) Transcript_1167:433-789(-)
MLTLAFGLSKCGWGIGISWFILCAILSGFTAHLLNCIAMVMPNKRLTFNTVSVHAGLDWLAPITDIVLFINNALMDTVYLQVFAIYQIRVGNRYYQNQLAPHSQRRTLPLQLLNRGIT